MKEELNCMQKNYRNLTNGSGDKVLRRKNHRKLVPKAYFRPLRTDIGLNFHFYVLFFFSDKKQKG